VPKPSLLSLPLLFVLAVSQAAEPAPASREAEIGEVTTLAPLDVNDIYNRRVRNLDLAGRPTLVYFFSDACTTCADEARVINLYRARHREFNYLAVMAGTKEEALRFVQQHRLDWPVAFEAGTFIAAMKVTDFPVRVLVASDGRILGRGSALETHDKQDPSKALAEFETWVSARLAR